jgi:hypothetical protein
MRNGANPTVIQVDMFDVQLGAALLIQFREPHGDVVRVLADAGVDPRSKYKQDHVLMPLKQAMRAFDDRSHRLDLIIGTHYDADHLEGLVPIINDRSIDIVEAWMPPVANDTQPHAIDDEPQEREVLAKQFEAENGRSVLERYFQAKHGTCAYLEGLQRAAEDIITERNRGQPSLRRPPERRRSDDWLEEHRSAFIRHISEASAALGESPEAHTHADDDIQIPPDLDVPGFVSYYNDSAKIRWFEAHWLWTADDQRIVDHWKARHERAEIDVLGVALLRKSSAKDAITASSLYKVVSALRSRKIPILCRIIDDGEPRRFVWRHDVQRFMEGVQLVGAPELKLLGPSRGLVRKHWNRLPIGDYARMMFAALLPSKSISPSNQLSYVARLGFDGQGIFISGDAGCVDFKPGRGSGFFKPLLDALLPLHVIQVAHHGGRNAQFYNALLSARYASQPAASKLLLSHATNDATRPSDLFGRFVAAIRKNVDNVEILFTGRPREAYVRDYRKLIASPVGTPQSAGDIRLEFDGRNWAVTKHAVEVR